MIYDNIRNRAFYEQYEGLSEAFEFILSFDGRAPGKYEISDSIIVLVQDRATEPMENRKFENHDSHIDIQYIIEGHEGIAVTNYDKLPVAVPHNRDNDVTYYEGLPNGMTVLAMKKGDFAVFYPHDFHMAYIGHGGNVKKIVVKILIKK